MTETKKTSTVKSTVNAETAGISAAVVTSEKEPAKKEEVKTTKTAKAANTAAKKTAKPAAKKAPAKKEAKAVTKTAAKAPAKKTDAKQIINLQFSGKSYSIEDLTKIAEDVWKYDLHKSDEAYKSLELYVKPEESISYYVFNGDISGSFFI